MEVISQRANNTENIDISSLEKGIYVYRINNETMGKLLVR